MKSAMLALGLGAAGADDERGTMDIEKVYGTQSPFKDLRTADRHPNKLVPYGSSGNPYGFFQGGIIGLAQGGDFPRKNGPIAGPGTETSDEIPAMLSDGEFVVNAKTVRGLGSKLGGQGREDERDRGSKYLYDKSSLFREFANKSSLFKEKRLTFEDRHRFRYIMDNYCNVVSIHHIVRNMP